MNLLIKYINLLFRNIIIIFIAAMVVIICLQVFCRFALGQALSWPEEASRFLMIWALFLAAVYAHYDREHIGINYFVHKLPQKYSYLIRMFTNILIIIFLVVLSYGGFQEMSTLINMKTGALRISRAWPYAITPISSILFIIVTIKLCIEDFQEFISK